MIGGTSGIGLELSRRFLKAGSAVVVGGRRGDVLARLAGEGFGTAEIDVTDAGSVARARDQVLGPAVATGMGGASPSALALEDFGAEVMDLLAQDPTPDEILVRGVLMHRWAERDGTYDELVAQRSQALATLPSRAPAKAQAQAQAQS